MHYKIIVKYAHLDNGLMQGVYGFMPFITDPAIFGDAPSWQNLFIYTHK